MTKNPAFATAYRKGQQARALGNRREWCPYPDKRGNAGFNTWSRAFRNAWVSGWDDKDREIKDK